MATISFTKGSAAAVEVTIVPGSYQFFPQHDDRGGQVVPRSRAGISRAGQCQVVVTDANLESLVALRSGVGEGDYTVTGDEIPSGEQAYNALVDVEIAGDSVMLATVSWKGTKPVA